MTADPPTPRWRLLALNLFWAAAFALSYTQAPLYYSNQNQYFLHGLAAAGHGQLRDDWLANTADPTPVFSAVVQLTDRLAGEKASYVLQFLMLALYCLSMLRIFSALCPRPPTTAERWLFAALLMLTHAGLPRLLSARWLDVDYPVYLQSGLAAQYVLRFGLQPSVAGVFLVAAVAAFLSERPTWAAVLMGLATAFHPTYLLPAALLTAGFLAELFRERRFVVALRTGGVALLLALPVAIDSAMRFGPTSADVFAEAQRLLARFRIPHHTEPRRWFDWIAGLQLAWFAAALFLVRQHRLFRVLLVTAGVSLALSLVQLAIENDTLALLFPWRTSAILIPIATTILLGRLALILGPLLDRREVVACGLLMAALVAGGVVIDHFPNLAYRTSDDELPLMNWVKATAKPGDVYLIPVNVPKLGTGPRGAVASDFTPPPRPAQRNQIAVDLQRFRLYTGVPIYVDFKAVPYKDVEVLEWKRRLDFAQQTYADSAWDAEELRRRGITHVVTSAGQPIFAPGFKALPGNAAYRVYRLND